METLPLFISVVFGMTSLLTVWFFYLAANKSKIVLLLLSGWILLQSVISLSNFYKQIDSIPPNLMLGVLPNLLVILLLFTTAKGKRFINGLDEKWLTLLHVIRIPVEVVLFWLFLYHLVPQLMTFEGRNFDILCGFTAPFIWYFGYVHKTISRKIILGWNFICLLLLFNIVINAVLSAPFPFQQFALDQPNIAILNFPFSLLPTVVVPLVLLSHLAVIRKLILK